jgi:hypothetical protein
MNRISLDYLLVLMAMSVGGSAPAGPLYQYVFNQPNYDVEPGGTVAVTISIQETFNPQTDASLLAPGTDGLIGGGLLVRVAAPLPASPARVLSTGAITGNPLFDVAQLPQLPAPNVPNSAGILELASSPVFGTITSQSATSETVLLPLATFTFTAGSVPGEVNSLMAMNTTIDGSTPSANNTTFSGVVLDPLLQSGAAAINVAGSVVPEPSGLTLMMIAGVAGAMIQHMRRRKRPTRGRFLPAVRAFSSISKQLR